MKKNDFYKTQFISSAISSALLYILTIYRYVKGKPFWYLILIVAIVMSLSAYENYKKMK
ncbi:MAG: hypothetical protein SOW41_00330 [Anaerococcus sp.]|jgi:hypothetical protein|nr:hypothetical protein [Peptoniphilaceae bacterium]MDY3054486.1 hypothetical protein [Anaerococcus sp.]